MNISKLNDLESILRNNYFSVPDYQRSYSWEQEQVQDLIDDIEKLSSADESKHYTGTLVITNKGARYDIVDGQQRLTTLSLILIAISKVLDDADITNEYILRGDIGRKKQVLELNDITNSVYKQLSEGHRNPEIEFRAHEILLNAYNHIEEYCISKKNSLNELKQKVLKRLGFIVYKPSHSKDIGIMFEVINNRGKQLTTLEKIKNYFIYLSSTYDLPQLRDSVNYNWTLIQKYLAKAGINADDEDTVLRSCFTCYYKYSKLKRFHIYEALKNRYKGNFGDDSYSEIRNFLEFLAGCSKYHAWLLNKSTSETALGSDTSIHKSLKKLRHHPLRASVMPLVLAVLSKMENDDISRESCGRLLATIEKLNFRIYVLPDITKRNDTLQGELFPIAYKYYNNLPLDETSDASDNLTAVDQLESILEKLIVKHCPEIKFVEGLTLDDQETFDYYSWQGLRFFLAEYERHLQFQGKKTFDIDMLDHKHKKGRQETNDKLTIEHIWALEYLSDRYDDFDSEHIQKRRLGNLMLLGSGSNSSLGKLPLVEKLKIIKNNESAPFLSQVRGLEGFYNESKEYLNKIRDRKTKYYYNELYTKINDLRETEMIKFALDNWKLENEQFNEFVEVNSFENNNYDKNFTLKDRK